MLFLPAGGCCFNNGIQLLFDTSLKFFYLAFCQQVHNIGESYLTLQLCLNRGVNGLLSGICGLQ